eukprot:PLAT11812.1.p1 GENE.PLAT11812.1~~PLAT11812.1.p1  ORF type:complete len:183 (+),score=83.59 PLAT11812.1:34-582(+)
MLKTRLTGGMRTYRVLVLGHPRVGKSALLQCLATGEFEEEYKETMGAELVVKDLESSERERVTLELWSCGGHKRFVPLTQQLFAGVHGVILCYDVTDPVSFKELVFWHGEVTRELSDAAAVVVGCKSDLVEERAVAEEDGRLQAGTWDMPHMTTSSKLDRNVTAVLQELLLLMTAKEEESHK